MERKKVEPQVMEHKSSKPRTREMPTPLANALVSQALRDRAELGNLLDGLWDAEQALYRVRRELLRQLKLVVVALEAQDAASVRWELGTNEVCGTQEPAS